MRQSDAWDEERKARRQVAVVLAGYAVIMLALQLFLNLSCL